MKNFRFIRGIDRCIVIGFLVCCCVFTIGCAGDLDNDKTITDSRPKRGTVFLIPTDSINESPSTSLNNDDENTSSSYIRMKSITDRQEIAKRLMYPNDDSLAILMGRKINRPRGTKGNDYACYCKESKCRGGNKSCRTGIETVNELNWKNRNNDYDDDDDDDDDEASDTMDAPKFARKVEPMRFAIPLANKRQQIGNDLVNKIHHVVPVYQKIRPVMPSNGMSQPIYRNLMKHQPYRLFNANVPRNTKKIVDAMKSLDKNSGTETGIQSVDERPASDYPMESRQLTRHQIDDDSSDELRYIVKRVINNFLPENSRDLLADTENVPSNEELHPDIVELPILRNLFAVPVVENMLVDAIDDYSSLTLNESTVDRRESIKEILREVVECIPEETNSSTADDEDWIDMDTASTNDDDVTEKIRHLIDESGLKRDEAAEPLIRNVIVKTVKHWTDKERGAVDESGVRRALDGIIVVQQRPDASSVNKQQVTRSTTPDMSDKDSTKQKIIDTKPASVKEDPKSNDGKLLGGIVTVSSKKTNETNITNDLSSTIKPINKTYAGRLLPYDDKKQKDTKIMTYVGDGVRIPMTMEKRPDGSYDLYLVQDKRYRGVNDNNDGKSRVTRETRSRIVIPELSFGDDESPRKRDKKIFSTRTKPNKASKTKKSNDEGRANGKNLRNAAAGGIESDDSYAKSAIGRETTENSANYRYQRYAQRRTNVIRNLLGRVKSLFV